MTQIDIDWDDPVARLALAERVTPEEYNRQHAVYYAKAVIKIHNGHEIRLVNSKFGPLYLVGTSGCAFQTWEGARTYAEQELAQ